MTAIHIKGLQVDDGQKTLLQALDFTIHPGTALTLIGESGSGKSLLAHALMGTLPAPLTGRGEMVSGGRHHNLADTPRLRTLWGRELAMLPQEPVLALDPTMGLLAQVEEGWLPGGKEARSRARAALERFGLAGREGAFVHQLSGGMAQRAAFAAATLGEARLLVADEPTKGLDSRAAARLGALLLGYLARGRHLLTITHDLSLARALGGWVLVVKGGEIVEQGPAERVLHTPSHAYTRALLAAEPSAWPEAACADAAHHRTGWRGALGWQRPAPDPDRASASGRGLSLPGAAPPLAGGVADPAARCRGCSCPRRSAP